MSEWTLEKNKIQKECLNSEWFTNILNNISRLVAFPFTIKNGKQIYYTKGDLSNNDIKKIKISPDLLLTYGFSNEIPSHPKEITDFVNLIKNSLDEKINLEYELNNLSAEILEKYEELNLLYEICTLLGALQTPEKIFEFILEKVEMALEVDRTSIMLLNEKTQQLEVVTAKGFELSKLEKPKVSLEKSISDYVLQKGESLMVEDIENLPKGVELNKKSNYSSQSFMTVPMIFSPIQVNQSKIGVINVTEKRNKNIFTSGDLKLLNSIASMAAIAIYNNRLLKKVVESERLKRDLQIAENIQLDMLPTEFLEFPDVDIYGKCRSAKNVGGDYFDFFVNDQTVDLLMADVSGHNIGAALMMANTRSVLQSLIHGTLPVSEILERANHLLYEDMSKTGFFISIFLMRYDRLTRQLSFTNGGHHPVFWYQKKHNKFVKLDAEGMLLGILPDVEFEKKDIQLEHGDLLVMYTDGLIETQNKNGDFFGYERLKNIISKFKNHKVQNIVNEIFSNSEMFANCVEQSDDITIQVMKVK